MWDDYERALVDAYLNWRNGMHRCGQHVHDSLRVAGRPDPVFHAGGTTCLGCKAIAEAQALFRQRNAELFKEGKPDPFAWMDWRAFSDEEAKQQAELDQARRFGEA